MYDIIGWLERKINNDRMRVNTARNFFIAIIIYDSVLHKLFILLKISQIKRFFFQIFSKNTLETGAKKYYLVLKRQNSHGPRK
jgi:hypothetical protein